MVKTSNTLFGKVETSEPHGGLIIIKHNGEVILEAKDIDTRGNDMVEAMHAAAIAGLSAGFTLGRISHPNAPIAK